MIEKCEVNYVKSRANLYHVPVKQWKKWTLDARQVFNEVYSSMVKNQVIFNHPRQEKISREHWKTVCWNAAWTAACAIQDIFAPKTAC